MKKSKLSFKFLALCIIANFVLFCNSNAQTDIRKPLTIKLDSGKEITCYREYQSGKKLSNTFVYLITSSMFKLGKKSNGELNFSLIQVTSNGENDAECPDYNETVFQAGISFGLSNNEYEELEEKIKKQIPDAILKGQLPIRRAMKKEQPLPAIPGDENDLKKVDGLTAYESPVEVFATLLNDGGNKILINNASYPPVSVGDNLIINGTLDAANGVLLHKAMTSGNSLISVLLNYEYTMMAPILNARMVFDWYRLGNSSSKFEEEYNKWIKTKPKFGFGIKLNLKPFRGLRGLFGGSSASLSSEERVGYSKKEIQALGEFLREKEIIKLEYVEYGFEEGSLDKERIDAIQEKIFEHIWASFIAANTTKKPPFEKAEIDEKATKEPKPVENVFYFKHTVQQKEKNEQIIHKEQFFNITLPVTFPLTMDYTIAIKPAAEFDTNTGTTPILVEADLCRNCLQLVNICDPAFERREVKITFDNYLHDLMKSGYINAITLQIKRGQNFHDEIVLTPSDMLNFNNYSFKYARNGEPNLEKYLTYDYKGVISFSNVTGFDDVFLNSRKNEWVTSNTSNLLVEVPVDYQFKIYNGKQITLNGNKKLLRDNEIASVSLLLADTLLGKRQVHNFTYRTNNNNTEDDQDQNDQIITVAETSASGYEYMLVYQTFSGKKFNSDLMLGYWDDVININSEIPKNALNQDFTVKASEDLPDLTDIARILLEEIIKKTRKR